MHLRVFTLRFSPATEHFDNRMQAEGRNPGFMEGTWIALRQLRSIQATLAGSAGGFSPCVDLNRLTTPPSY
jgi:hypothetical protein